MTYAKGHPIRLVGGRLALDFVNTADWSEDGRVMHEKVATPGDLNTWLDALNLRSTHCHLDCHQLQAYRADIRSLLRGGKNVSVLEAIRLIDPGQNANPEEFAAGQSLEALIAASAISILTDKRENARLKMCPGHNCGWLFIDETKNARRRWCSMETCGNRAKATRHYKRLKASQASNKD